jgi:hypothetical protein
MFLAIYDLGGLPLSKQGDCIPGSAYDSLGVHVLNGIIIRSKTISSILHLHHTETFVLCGRGKPMHAQDAEFSAVLKILDSFFFSFPITQLNFCWRQVAFQQISNFHFIASIKHIHVYLSFGAPFALGRQIFTEWRAGKYSDHTMI